MKIRSGGSHGYKGSAVATCATPGAPFTYGGCEIACIQPSADPAGYDVATTDGDGSMTVTVAENVFVELGSVEAHTSV